MTFDDDDAAAPALGDEPALFAGLIDDAAVFPPGNAPLDAAVQRHLRHRAAPYAGAIGPLLVPASDIDALVAQVNSTSTQGLEVGLIARPGVDPTVVTDAVARVAHEVAVTVVGAEVGWFEGWRDLPVGTLTLTLEAPRGSRHKSSLDDIAAGVHEGRAVQAKFRTGATSTWAWPDEGELAAFIAGAVGRDLPFKLTGGLHHAVRADHDGDPQHGLLNVLLAVHAADQGAATEELVTLLAERRAEVLTAAVTDLGREDVARLRTHLTAYGCCEVTDPIGELAALTLIHPDLLEESAS